MADNAEVISINGNSDCEDKTVERLLLRSKNSNKATDYLTPNTKQPFTQLRQAFPKALILQYFGLKYYIWIETYMLSYTIDGVLSQLTLDNLVR